MNIIDKQFVCHWSTLLYKLGDGATLNLTTNKLRSKKTHIYGYKCRN